MKRYSRHLLLPEFGSDGQSRLLNARVAVIGAGGLGSPILQYLAAAGVGHLTVIDPDLVDTTNLQRQVIHTEAAVGTPKTASAARAIRALNHDVRVREHYGVLTPANALEILQGHDLVLDGTDNFPTRYLVSDACEILDIPLVWGSILAFHGQVSVFYGDSGRGVTYRDVHPEPPKPGEVPSCSDAGVLGMLVGIIGSTMAMEAVKVLSGVGRPLFGRIKVFDALECEWFSIDVARTPGRAPVTELEDLVQTCGFPSVDGLEASVVADREGSGELREAPLSAAAGIALGGLAGGSGSVEGAADASLAPGAADEPEVLAPHEALEQSRSGRLLIDVREDDEVAGGMLPGAVHVPMGDLLAWAAGEESGEASARAKVAGLESARDLEGAIVHCQGGMRSAKVQAQLAAQGIRVADVAGGYAAAEPLARQ